MADEITYSYDEIFSTLSSAKSCDFDKIFALVELEEIKNGEDLKTFLSCLTNCSNPLREACAYKFEELAQGLNFDDDMLNIISDAICDINPNVSRAICSSIEKNKNLSKNLPERIISKLQETIFLLGEEKSQKTKGHAKNKLLFKIYWLLEALFFCEFKKYEEEVLKILNLTIDFEDYTIREKTAKILAKIEQTPDNLIKKAMSDTNFYVNFYIKR